MRGLSKSVLVILGALVVVAACDSKNKQSSQKPDPGAFLRDGVEVPTTEFVPVRESAPTESWADEIDTSTSEKPVIERGMGGGRGGVSPVASSKDSSSESNSASSADRERSGAEREKLKEVRESVAAEHPSHIGTTGDPFAPNEAEDPERERARRTEKVRERVIVDRLGALGNQSVDEQHVFEDPSHDEQTGETEARRRTRRRRSKAKSKKSDSDSTISLWGDHEPSESAGDASEDSKIGEASESVSEEVVFGPSPAEAKRRNRRDKHREDLAREVVEQAREAKKRELQPKRDRAERAPPASTTSTFSMDVDTGSYTLAGRKLARGVVPTAEEVRAEEFINFFEYDYPDPEGAFGLTVEGAPSPFRRQDNHVLVKFGVKARQLAAAEKNATEHVTVLVDVSRSMRDADALPIVEQSLGTLIEELDDSDSVSLVVYDSEPRLLLNSVPVSETEQIYDGVAELDADGASGLQEGLEFAYEHASRQRSAGTQSNVIVFSDGAANLGATRGRQLAREVSKTKAEDVGLTVLGVGDTEYNDDLLEQLADRGDGAYYHVNALPEAERLFGEKLEALLHTVARDAKIQVEFDPDAVASFRRIGYENRALPDEFFRRDGVDAAEIGPGQSVTVLFEVELADGARGRLGKISVRFNEPGGEDGKELAAEFRAEDFSKRFADASDDLRFSAAIAGFAEILERTELGRALDIDALVAVAESATKGREHRENAVFLIRRLIELAG